MLENETIIANLQAEQAVLGGLLACYDGAANFMQKIDFLKPEHFYEPVHDRIFSACLQLLGDGINPTPVTLKNIFDKDAALSNIGGAEYLARLAGKATAIINVKSYAIAIFDCYNRRRLADLAEWLKESCYDFSGSKNSEEILAKVNGAINEIKSGTQTHKIVTSKQVSIDITESFKQDLKFFQTKIPSLDFAMGGGLYESKAYSIAARKKVGKTIAASTISYNLNLQGVKHLFIAAEMSPAEIQQRNIARGIGRNSMSFITQDRNNLDFQNLVGKFAINDPAHIHYLHVPAISFDDLKRNVSLAIYKHGIKGFILDYFQLVGGAGARQSKVEFFDEVAQWIATVCRQEKIWALVTAQINQEDNIRWGEGLRLAFDQVYHLQKSEHQENMFFLEMMDTRYTPWCEVGTNDNPKIIMEKTGPYFREG